MDQPTTPFRDVWTALGKLHVALPGIDDTQEALERWREVALAVSAAEREWQQLARGPGEN